MASRLFHAIVLVGAQMACNRGSLPNQVEKPDLAVADMAVADLCSCQGCENPQSDCGKPGIGSYCHEGCSCFPCFI